MTVIFELGDVFYIERVTVTLTTAAAAGTTTSAQFSLSKVGDYLGHICNLLSIDGVRADFEQYTAIMAFEGAGNLPFVYGGPLTTVRAQIDQADATSRAIVIEILLFMRRPGR